MTEGIIIAWIGFAGTVSAALIGVAAHKRLRVQSRDSLTEMSPFFFAMLLSGGANLFMAGFLLGGGGNMIFRDDLPPIWPLYASLAAFSFIVAYLRRPQSN